MSSGTQPGLWVFAGPNGAGKSTFVQRCNIGSRIPVVNPDNIAGTPTAASRFAVEQRVRLLNNGSSFGIETTLTGRSELRLMQAAKERGYKVNLIYIGLHSVEQSNSRVMVRVRCGGHDVPEQDIYRRFSRSLANLAEAIRYSDRVRILDNSGERRRLILKIDQGQVKAVSQTMPEWVKAVLPR